MASTHEHPRTGKEEILEAFRQNGYTPHHIEAFFAAPFGRINLPGERFRTQRQFRQLRTRLRKSIKGLKKIVALIEKAAADEKEISNLLLADIPFSKHLPLLLPLPAPTCPTHKEIEESFRLMPYLATIFRVLLRAREQWLETIAGSKQLKGIHSPTLHRYLLFTLFAQVFGGKQLSSNVIASYLQERELDVGDSAQFRRWKRERGAEYRFWEEYFRGFAAYASRNPQGTFDSWMAEGLARLDELLKIAGAVPIKEHRHSV
jgi:hypothetical protein